MKQVWIGIAVCLCLSCTRMRDGQEGVVLDLTETGTDTLGFCDVLWYALSRWRRQTNVFWGM